MPRNFRLIVTFVAILRVTMFETHARSSVDDSTMPDSELQERPGHFLVTKGRGPGGPNSESLDRFELPRRLKHDLDKGCSGCRFWLGVGIGFGIHEGGHLVSNWALGVSPYLKAVRGGGVPFFAISHAETLTPKQEFIVSSAGLWSQFLAAEVILSHSPDLRDRRAAIRKGLLGFHIASSLLYGLTGLAHLGPLERDTRGMALGWNGNERWAGLTVLVPGLLDSYRYINPSLKWIPWASRVSKLMLIVPLLM